MTEVNELLRQIAALSEANTALNVQLSMRDASQRDQIRPDIDVLNRAEIRMMDNDQLVISALAQEVVNLRTRNLDMIELITDVFNDRTVVMPEALVSRCIIIMMQTPI